MTGILSIPTAQLLSILIQYRYILLFPIAVFEGPIITMFAGLLVSLGYMNFWVAYAILVAGDVTGDVLYYALGRWGREGFVSKWGHYFGLYPERVERVEKHFEENGVRTLIIGKFTHAAGTVFLVAAGMAKMPLWRFIWVNFLGTLVKSMALMLVGYYFGQAIGSINSFLEFITYLTAALVIVAAMVAFVYHRNKEID